MQVSKDVNKFLVSDMSREVYKWVFQDSLNKIGEVQSNVSKLDKLKFELNVNLHVIQSSKFNGLETTKIIERIFKGDEFEIVKYQTPEFIMKSIDTIPLPAFDSEKEKDGWLYTITQAFLNLIELNAQIYALEWKMTNLQLKCEICEYRILSPKIIHCKKCGLQSDEMYCCTPCIPEVYNSSHDPYLCSTCT